MKDNERRIIERRKLLMRKQRELMMQSQSSESHVGSNHHDNAGGVNDNMMYDPILDDLKSAKLKGSRQGDDASGLDAGLEALEGISFGSSSKTSTNGIYQENGSTTTDKRPLWVQEEELRQREPLKNVRFLRERGYTSSEATVACGGIGNNNSSAASKMYALKQLYNSSSSNETVASSSDERIVEVPEDIVQARIEEKEVLVSMFGFADDDDEAAARFSNLEDENALDVVLPVTAYVPPGRYDFPPPLMLEVYVDNNIAPLYPNEPPVLAVVGGGLPEARLKELTRRIQKEALDRAKDELCEPQIFNLLAFVGEAAEIIVQEETAELEEEQKRILETEKAAAAEARKEAQKRHQSSEAKFTSEAERRAFAKEVAAKAATGKPVSKDDDEKKKTGASKYYAGSGVNDRDLCKDLFS
eukprot:scaffold49246_cov37-Cyclotella_meneghiniana.AAC.1